MENEKSPILEIKDLRVTYETDIEVVEAVNGISFQIEKGKTLGLVGETGAGKTTTALSILRLLPETTGRIKGGEICFEGEDLLHVDEEQMRVVRGNRISMVFQDPMSSLNPVYTVGDQIGEAIRLHRPELSNDAVEQRIDEILQLVGIMPSRKHEYPHQFSGGMKQRVVIAMALCCEPELLIADEPTTALDVTIQAQVLAMIAELRSRLGTSMLMITHDLGIVARTCDDVCVMYAGKIVEAGTVEDIFLAPSHHPYTEGLFGSIPNLTTKARRLKPILGLMPDPTNLPKGCEFAPRCEKCMEICRTEKPKICGEGSHKLYCHLFDPDRQKTGVGGNTNVEMSRNVDDKGNAPLLETIDLKKYFKVGGGTLHAVDSINIKLYQGETLGVVGESGCGKSTLGRTILKLIEPTAGHIIYDGKDITSLNIRKMRPLRREMQIIFQDPYSSIDPRKSVIETISEYMFIHKSYPTRREIMNRAVELMDMVGLARRYADAYPHELDGGRRQRIGIARALSLQPRFIVCDEPVSALDMSIQAQILNLLMDLQDELNLSYMFVTHDLSVVKHISDQIMVMYLGICIEFASSDELFQKPLHPYTKALLAAIPEPDLESRKKGFQLIRGEVSQPD